MGEQRTQYRIDVLLLLTAGGNAPLQASIYLRSLIGAKTAADLVFHLERSEVPFRLIVSEGHPFHQREGQNRLLVLLQAAQQISSWGALGTFPASLRIGRGIFHLRLTQNLTIPFLGLQSCLPAQGALPVVQFQQVCIAAAHTEPCSIKPEFPQNMGIASPVFRLRKLVIHGHMIVNGPPGKVLQYRVGWSPDSFPRGGKVSGSKSRLLSQDGTAATM